MKILVTPTSLNEHSNVQSLQDLRDTVDDLRFAQYGRPLTAAELVHELRDIDGVIAGLDEFNADVFAAAPRLRVVARYGVGLDRIDLAAAAAHGVTITRTPGANAIAVAEMTIGLLFAVARCISRLDTAVKLGQWPREHGLELTGRRFGIVGFGAIGQEVAQRAHALGMTTSAFDPNVADSTLEAAGVTPRGLDDLCANSDVLSVHVPLIKETANLIDGRRIALLPSEAILLNTARGGLVDEMALLSALNRGDLFGAAIDAFVDEPPRDSSLVRHPRVVSTPHAAGHTREATDRMANEAIASLLDVLGDPQSRM